MKMLLTSIITLLFCMNSFAQGMPGMRPSYNIGKSPDIESYPADSIPLFVLKDKRKSKKISPSTTLKLAPKGNNITNVILEYIKEIHIFKDTEIPRKYRNDRVFQVCEIYILDDKFDEAFKFLKDRGYF